MLTAGRQPLAGRIGARRTGGPRAAVWLKQWLQALGVGRLLFALLTTVALIAAARQLGRTPQLGVDAWVLQGLQQWLPSQLGPPLVRIYRLTGVQFSAVLVLAMAIFLALKRFWAEFTCLLVGSGGILVIVDRLLKPLFGRLRPADSLLELQGGSFPSGHAAGSVVFYLLSASLLALHVPRLRIPLLVGSSLWMALVWLSALYCRAHWLSDIAAGAAVGYVWLSCCLAGFTVWRRHHPATTRPHG